MRKLLSVIILLILATTFMTGCSWDRVPPAHKGKVLTGSGYQQEVLDPGRQFTWWWQNLVLLDVSTQTFSEDLTVILNDRLELDFEVMFRANLRSDPEIINAMFDTINIPRDTDVVDLGRVYDIYGKMVIENKAREVLNAYTSEEVYKNYAVISNELAQAIIPELESTPIQLENVTITSMKFPPVVTEAIEVAKERELAIQKERAQNEIDLLKKENERALAEAEYQTRMTKAKTIRDESRTIAEGVTPELLKFRALEIQEIFAEHAGKNGKVTFMPIEALSSVGANVRMYNENKN
jgi:regulator of protease activity HflC (stomatin/prohibitin superfamily)